MSRLTTPGIHHVALTARDASRTRDFYRDVLGLWEVERPGQEGYWLGDEPGRPGTLVSVRAGVEAGVGQTRHVAFRAANAAELSAWEAHFRTRGVEVTAVPAGVGGGLEVRPPDGLVLQIVAD